MLLKKTDITKYKQGVIHHNLSKAIQNLLVLSTKISRYISVQDYQYCRFPHLSG